MNSIHQLKYSCINSLHEFNISFLPNALQHDAVLVLLFVDEKYPLWVPGRRMAIPKIFKIVLSPYSTVSYSTIHYVSTPPKFYYISVWWCIKLYIQILYICRTEICGISVLGGIQICSQDFHILNHITWTWNDCRCFIMFLQMLIYHVIFWKIIKSSW